MKSFKFSDLAEFFISLFFVGAVIGGLTFWAQSHTRPPATYGKDTTIVLLPIEAIIEGDIKLYPTSVENQEKDFTYKHGREILKEQQSRKAGNWTNTDSSLAWTFVIDSPQKYKVSLTYASEGVHIEVSLNNKTLTGTLENTEGMNSFKELELGEIELPAGTHTLTLKGTAHVGILFPADAQTHTLNVTEIMAEELLRLESVTLKP